MSPSDILALAEALVRLGLPTDFPLGVVALGDDCQRRTVARLMVDGILCRPEARWRKTSGEWGPWKRLAENPRDSTITTLTWQDYTILQEKLGDLGSEFQKLEPKT